MALSPFQRGVCRLLASQRLAQKASYIAGGVALNETLHASRLSRDVDVFHDSLEALEMTWQNDRVLLEAHGYDLDIVRERSGFVEAIVYREGETVEMQWVRDSAFRFFPLLPHPDFGLTLHAFDLATNKVLALVGRVEARDWIDILTCHQKVAPLGLLAWAACGKDEGWNPLLIVEEAARTARYTRDELLELDWQGAPPDFSLLKAQWRSALSDARALIEALPPEFTGQAVLDTHNVPFQGDFHHLQQAMRDQSLRFHPGHIGGAWPQVKGE
ncbi:MAG TPA: hypothetical protein VF600_15265 [Abditibacteriaceae bacterium]|jgi:hypothetical protein